MRLIATGEMPASSPKLTWPDVVSGVRDQILLFAAQPARLISLLRFSERGPAQGVSPREAPRRAKCCNAFSSQLIYPDWHHGLELRGTTRCWFKTHKLSVKSAGPR